MKDSTEYSAIDTKFILAIDKIIYDNKALGIKPANDSALAGLIYPSNRAIISSVRNKKKHIPHLALINLSKYFKVDMNYFYSDAPFIYIPPIVKNINKTDNSIHHTSGNNTVFNQLGEGGTFNKIDTAAADSKSTVIETIEVNTMINKFLPKIDNADTEQFLCIISKIQSESKQSIKRIEKLLDAKQKELECFRSSYKDELVATRKELSDINAKLHDSQMREIDLLKSLIKKDS